MMMMSFKKAPVKNLRKKVENRNLRMEQMLIFKNQQKIIEMLDSFNSLVFRFIYLISSIKLQKQKTKKSIIK